MPSSIYHFDGWKLDTGRRQLFNPDGIEVRMTSYELNLLIFFCRHPQQVIPRTKLSPRIDGRVLTFERAVDVRIARIRQKIEANSRSPNLIKTIRGEGYWFSPDVTTE